MYVEFLGAMGVAAGHGAVDISGPPDTAAATQAYMVLELEGPDSVARAGAQMALAMRRRHEIRQDEFLEARQAFVVAAQVALAEDIR